MIIFGASARAAAFSALRAGLRPWCADLFADRDLQARCPVRRIAGGQYPSIFAQLVTEAPATPWMYTGGLENRPALVTRVSRRRHLWGCDAESLRKARSPRFLFQLLTQSDLPCPRLWEDKSQSPSPGRWLMKSRAGSGGFGVRFFDAELVRHKERIYIQEFIEGESCSSVFVGDGHRARLLGTTRQLVGQAWLHASAFHYCGSIGPLGLSEAARKRLQRLGHVLAVGCGLRGLFGIDFILRDHVPWLVEVNPRYTASIEVLEHATGMRALKLHQGVFAGTLVKDGPAEDGPTPAVVGKAILFSRAALVFPADGPWQATLDPPTAITQMPAFGDIPSTGERIAIGRPILTCFAKAATVMACLEQLQQVAAHLDRVLFGA